MKNKNQSYYDLFIEMGAVLNRAIATAKKTLSDFNPKSLAKQMTEIHDIEAAGDEITHQVMKKLTKDFITPLDREDLINLANAMDNIIDSVEDIVQKIYMYNIKKIDNQAIDFFQIVEQCSTELNILLKELPNFKKSKTIRNSIIEINRLEELGDGLHLEAMRKLYQNNSGPIEVMAWTQIYDSLEKCCDVCELVADSIDSIIMKNL